MLISETAHFAVALDGTDMDNKIVDYLKFILPLYPVKKIIFFTLIVEGQIPENKQYSSNFKKFVNINFKDYKDKKVDIKALVFKTSRPADMVNKLTEDEDIHTIVVGRKNLKGGSGGLLKMLSRRVLCNLLTITRSGKNQAKRILIPIDFSEQTKLVMEWVLASNAYFKFKEVVFLHVSALPTGYTLLGKTPQEYANIMINNVKQEFDIFIKPYLDSGINFKSEFYVDQIGKHTHEIIFNTALIYEVDLIIIATQGRTRMAATLIRSTTEKLLNQNIIIPTMVLKKGDKNMGFIDALGQI